MIGFLVIEPSGEPNLKPGIEKYSVRIGKVIIGNFNNTGFYRPESKQFKPWIVYLILPLYNRTAGFETKEECIEYCLDVAKDYFKKLKTK